MRFVNPVIFAGQRARLRNLNEDVPPRRFNFVSHIS